MQNLSELTGEPRKTLLMKKFRLLTTLLTWFATILYREADLKVKWDCMIDEFDFTSDDVNLPLSDEIEDDDEGDW